MERCIRDKDGRICGWLVGWSWEDIYRFLEENEGTYLSVSFPNERGEYR